MKIDQLNRLSHPGEMTQEPGTYRVVTLDEIGLRVRRPGIRKPRHPVKPAPTPEAVAERQADAMRRRRERAEQSKLRLRLARYCMTVEQYEEKLAAQDGRCAICRREASTFVVDHDHRCCPKVTTCGQCNRDLLCIGCNSGLGLFGEDPEVLAAAIAYISKYSLLTASRVSCQSTAIDTSPLSEGDPPDVPPKQHDAHSPGCPGAVG